MKKIYLTLITCILASTLSAQWTPKGSAIEPPPLSFDSFGESVSMSDDGHSVIIGDFKYSNTGIAKVYTWNGTAWNQKGNDIIGNVGDNSARATAISGDGNTVIVGAYFAQDTGAVRVYEWNGSNWTMKGNLILGDYLNEWFGWSVGINTDGNTIIVGAVMNNVNNAGRGVVFEWNGSSWLQKGNTVNGENSGDNFGASVSISSDGNTIAVGGHVHDNKGHVKIYEWIGSAWAQKGVDIDGDNTSDGLGVYNSMSADGNTIIIGAHNGGVNGSGYANIYQWNGTSWMQMGNSISEAAFSILSSVDIASDSLFIVMGARHYDGSGSNNGKGRVFSWNGSTWALIGGAFVGGSPEEHLGASVSINADGSSIILGAPGSSSNPTMYAQAYHICPLINTGVSYISSIELASDTAGTDITYQWINCLDSSSLVGETSQNFLAQTNGDFALIINQDGCMDTTSCYTIGGVGVFDNDFGDGLLIYPNPTKGNFSIDLGVTYNTATITITDLNGKIILSKIYNENQLLNLRVEEPAGVYFLRIESGDKKAVIRLIKE